MHPTVSVPDDHEPAGAPQVWYQLHESTRVMAAAERNTSVL